MRTEKPKLRSKFPHTKRTDFRPTRSVLRSPFTGFCPQSARRGLMQPRQDACGVKTIRKIPTTFLKEEMVTDMSCNKRTNRRSRSLDTRRESAEIEWRRLAAEFDEHRASEAFGAKASRRNRRERKLDDKRDPYR
ncbi:MAG: hypothetical protein IT343_03640 [Candidatus Melainabacteria bacterium]|nr:hypothetical protein [Candidatus Melainabacteria bacterium]